MIDQEERVNTSERILDSAKSIFSHRGKHGARMQEIADLAGVNKALLFYYFSSKDKLYEEVMRHIITHIFEDINAVVLSGASPGTKIATVVDTYISYMNDNPYVPGIISSEVASGAETIKKVLSDLKKSGDLTLPQTMINMLIEGKKNDLLRDIDPDQTILSIIGLCIIYFLGKPLIRDILHIREEEENQFLERRMRHIIDLVENGILKR